MSEPPNGPHVLRQKFWCSAQMDPAVEECPTEYQARSHSYSLEVPAEVERAWQSMTTGQRAFSEGLCAWQELFDQLEIQMKRFKEVTTEVQTELRSLRDVHLHSDRSRTHVHFPEVPEEDIGDVLVRPSEEFDAMGISSESNLSIQRVTTSANSEVVGASRDSQSSWQTTPSGRAAGLDQVSDFNGRERDSDALTAVKGWKKQSRSQGGEFKEGGSKHRIANCVGLFSTALVLTNMIVTGLKVHINLERAKKGETESTSLLLVDNGLTVLFCVELVVRVALFKRHFFAAEWRAWNTFDVLLTLTGALEATLSFWDLKFLRSLRIFRAIRVVRVLRGLRLVHELRLMVASVIVSMGSLVWACVFLVFILYLFAIIISIDVAAHLIHNDSVDPSLMEYYGSTVSSMLSLFKGISGGADWEILMEPLLKVDHFFYTIFFVFYIFFTIFGVTNVLTAIFCDAATRVSQIDRDLVIQDQIAQSDSYANELKNLFNETCSAEHVMNKQDLEAHLDCPEVQHYLKFMELDVQEARGLFQLLDVDESGYVSVDEFVIGMMRLKGAAKGVDVATLMYENKKLYVRVVALAKFTEERFQNLERVIRGEEEQHLGTVSLADHLQDEEDVQRALKVAELTRAKLLAKRLKLHDTGMRNSIFPAFSLEKSRSC